MIDSPYTRRGKQATSLRATMRAFRPIEKFPLAVPILREKRVTYRASRYCVVPLLTIEFVLYPGVSYGSPRCWNKARAPKHPLRSLRIARRSWRGVCIARQCPKNIKTEYASPPVFWRLSCAYLNGVRMRLMLPIRGSLH